MEKGRTFPTSAQRSNSNGSFLRICFFAIATFVLFTYWNRHQFTPAKMSTSDITSKLDVSLQQTSTTPPKITLKVTNKADTPVTLLTWNSPLDRLAIKLGLVTITGDGKKLDIPTIQVNRRMPPGEESLAEIAAGASKEETFELFSPLPPIDDVKGAKEIVIKVEGMLRGWPKKISDIPKSSLAGLGATDDGFNGEFATQELKLKIE